MSSSQSIKAPTKTPKKSKTASSKKSHSTNPQNTIQDISNDSDCDVDPVHLAALLNKAKDSASVDPTKLENEGFKTKAFKNGKFFDPIGDSVKRQLYIQDIDAKAESSIKSKSAKLSFYKKAVDGTGKLDISAPTKASFTKDPQTCVEQALALSKTKGIESYKIKYDLVKKLSKAESTKVSYIGVLFQLFSSKNQMPDRNGLICLPP
ncbi:dTDP-fucopyranose mutase [Entomophthora muscae]|uniref:dTDP-fucopyranose mutase n=1 Tax=Entomophthora muscae TaxID=34485 RepID=A0ACC2RLS6_9FUNG|nr:dTDP-fucopyranose mutase [Entomophthora muscae]